MRTELFDFELPSELIAQQPVRPREAARLLRIGTQLADLHVADLPTLLRPGDLLVLNDTRVLPTRFFARRGSASIEVTLIQAKDARHWWGLAKPGRKVRLGDRLDLAEGFAAHAVEKTDDGRILLDFELEGMELIERIKATGHMPLPPYIRRPRGGHDDDAEAYQTVFAKKDGSVAAPTASLHLGEAMLAELATRGVAQTFVTLHVGMGTFLPVKSNDTADHVMHHEWYDVPGATAKAVNRAKSEGGRIIAVGTTVARTLEAAAQDGRLQPGAGTTDLFITPGYDFQLVDCLMTNFHLPRSTLFMLVSAFSGLATMQAAYAHAIAHRYRFFSYGDACFLERP